MAGRPNGRTGRGYGRVPGAGSTVPSRARHRYGHGRVPGAGTFAWNTGTGTDKGTGRGLDLT